jgi:hypothetical protein
MTYRKHDVTFHAEHWQDGHAAVDVKDQQGWHGLREAIPRALDDLGMVLPTGAELDDVTNMIAEHDGASDYSFAAEDGWEQASALAWETFGAGYDVCSEGRSGGWLVVTRRAGGVTCFDEEDVAGWDAIALQRWATFERRVREIADDQAYRVAWNYFDNVADAGADIAGHQLTGVGL